MTNKFKYVFLSLLACAIIFISESSFALVAEDCQAYPGLVNKVVSCVTRMVSYGLVGDTLTSIYDRLTGVSNAAVIIYLSFFGFKMTTGGVQNLRKEAFWVILSAAAILGLNNTVSVNKFLNVFLRAQTEFASAATFAVSTRPPELDENGAVIQDKSYNSVCFGPKEVNRNYDPNDPTSTPTIPAVDNNGNPQAYGIWQRVDCIIGFVIGAHPIVERTSQYFTPDGDSSEVAGVDLSNKRFDWDIFATDRHPFLDPAVDPFCFLKDVKDVNTDDLSLGGPDGCDGKRLTMKASGLHEVGVTYSLLIIAVGMFFESAEDGAIGVMVLFTGIFIIFLMIFAFGQVAMVYLSSMFGIIILALLAPICVPCILFKPTKQVFQLWLQNFFGFTIKPGLMLAYLTFMIFVIQFIINYSKPITQGDNGEEIPGFNSLMDMHYGEMFKNGFKGYKSFIRTSTDTSTKTDADGDELSDDQTKTDGTISSKGVSGDVNEGSKLNLSDDESMKETKSQTNIIMSQAQGLARLAGDFDTNVSGVTDSSLSTPSFSFAVKQCQEWSNGICTKSEYVNINQAMSKYIKAQQLNSGAVILDTESFLKSMQEKGEEINEQVNAVKRQHVANKANYMQILLVVFLTLSITISFMHNVMSFADVITGSGGRPISRAVDLYNMNVSRASKTLWS